MSIAHTFMRERRKELARRQRPFVVRCRRQVEPARKLIACIRQFLYEHSFELSALGIFAVLLGVSLLLTVQLLEAQDRVNELRQLLDHLRAMGN